MENDAQRSEFVMNDTGKVYLGGSKNTHGRPWVYGQFDDCVLPAACVLLEMSRLTHAERGNPVKVSRALCAMVRAGSHSVFCFSYLFSQFSLCPFFFVLHYSLYVLK